jgi:hypothetical protein
MLMVTIAPRLTMVRPAVGSAAVAACNAATGLTAVGYSVQWRRRHRRLVRSPRYSP